MTARALWLSLALIGWVGGATAQQAPELLIRNGLIITETGRVMGDLRIRDGLIAEIGQNLTPGQIRTPDTAPR